MTQFFVARGPAFVIVRGQAGETWGRDKLEAEQSARMRAGQAFSHLPDAWTDAMSESGCPFVAAGAELLTIHELPLAVEATSLPLWDFGSWRGPEG